MKKVPPPPNKTVKRPPPPVARPFIQTNTNSQDEQIQHSNPKQPIDVSDHLAQKNDIPLQSIDNKKHQIHQIKTQTIQSVSEQIKTPDKKQTNINLKQTTNRPPPIPIKTKNQQKQSHSNLLKSELPKTNKIDEDKQMVYSEIKSQIQFKSSKQSSIDQKKSKYNKLHQKLKDLSNARQKLEMSDESDQPQEKLIISQQQQQKQQKQIKNPWQNEENVELFREEEIKIQKNNVNVIQEQKVSKQQQIVNNVSETIVINPIEEKLEDIQFFDPNELNKIQPDPIFIQQKNKGQVKKMKISQQFKQIIDQKALLNAEKEEVKRLSALFEEKKKCYLINIGELQKANKIYKEEEQQLISQIQQLISVMKQKDSQIQILLNQCS